MNAGRTRIEREYWGPVFDITREGDDIRFLIEGDKVLIAKIGSLATKLRDVPRKGPTRGRPWARYFRYTALDDGTNQVTHTENRAADCVPVDLYAGEYFLIRRDDSGKLAVPGGMIDPDEILGPNEARWQDAALRELREETGIRPEQLLTVHQLSERPIKGDDPREHTTTMPFIAVVVPGVRGFVADDAVAEAMEGFEFGTVPPLVFSHHKVIIEMAVDFARALRA